MTQITEVKEYRFKTALNTTRNILQEIESRVEVGSTPPSDLDELLSAAINEIALIRFNILETATLPEVHAESVYQGPG